MAGFMVETVEGPSVTATGEASSNPTFRATTGAGGPASDRGRRPRSTDEVKLFNSSLELGCR